ncbi:MAG: asparagine synthase (glutamine-hydrolyzing), partial [Anaerolineales bacterium]|nr:asparagine synthase (glutamine-hydrolyzing) [Anaerolineales bacterium]
SILDLSPAGHQPMFSADGRYVIVFNGEVYNFGELRDELERLGHAFRGHSDTEVMLAAISQWGIESAVKRFNGMFAIALWDHRERRLTLVRDRLGIKPLYYGWMGDVFLFGSELKALRAHPAFRAEIDRDALALYLRHNYIPAPYSIYRGVFKLTPGTFLTIRADSRPAQDQPQVYWNARQIVESGLAHPFEGNEQEAVEALDAHLRRSVGLRMIADVPLGAFLSGGVDSSTIVALMQAQSHLPVKTFTIGFHESGFDEAKYAKAVARHLGTQHTELYVSPEQARAVIPLLPKLYDEPFADSSQIPTFLVSQLARRHVTVSLSGDGGDELFGGYNRYFMLDAIWKRIGWMPLSLRKLASSAAKAVPTRLWPTLFRFLPDLADFPNPADKAQKLAEIIASPSPEAIYLDLVSHWKQPASVVLNAREPVTALLDRSRWADLTSFTDQMMFLDLITYLPGDILNKVDRASMGVSLEARAPFLDDHQTLEFAWSLPRQYKIRGGQGKWILRQVLYRYVPRELIERPKMGFGIPIDSWLRGPLREWAETLLDERRMQQEGFFNPQPIRQKWAEHISRKRNWQYHLWDILIFQAWLEAQH